MHRTPSNIIRLNNELCTKVQTILATTTSQCFNIFTLDFQTDHLQFTLSATKEIVVEEKRDERKSGRSGYACTCVEGEGAQFPWIQSRVATPV